MHRHGDAYAAHHHVGDDGEDDSRQQQQRDGRHDQLQSGKHEHVETVVDAELRVLGTEALRVEHQQDLGPVRVEPCAEHQADDQRDDHRYAARASGTDAFADLYGVAVDPDRRSVGAVRTSPDGKRRGEEADRCHDDGIRDPQADPRAELRPDHALEAELGVPHDIRDETREREEEADDNGQREHDAEEYPIPPRLAGPIRSAGDARTRGSPWRHARGGLRRVISVRLDIEDDRIVARSAIAPFSGTSRTVFGIEHGTKHIKKRHGNSLSAG